jgi:hypothetical protein
MCKEIPVIPVNKVVDPKRISIFKMAKFPRDHAPRRVVSVILEKRFQRICPEKKLFGESDPCF